MLIGKVGDRPAVICAAESPGRILLDGEDGLKVEEGLHLGMTRQSKQDESSGRVSCSFRLRSDGVDRLLTALGDRSDVHEGQRRLGFEQLEAYSMVGM